MNIPLDLQGREPARIWRYIKAVPVPQGRVDLTQSELQELMELLPKPSQQAYEAITLAYYYGIAKAMSSVSRKNRIVTGEEKEARWK